MRPITPKSATVRRFPARVIPLAALLLSACAGGHGALLKADPANAIFTRDIKPLLEHRCLPCHNGVVLAGRLDLTSRKTAFQPGPAGPFIVPGHPGKSRLFTFIILSDEAEQAMPPTGHGLSEVEILLLEDWIRRGADWPAGRAGKLKIPPGAEPRSVRTQRNPARSFTMSTAPDQPTQSNA